MTRLEYLQAVKKLLPIAPVCAEIGVYRGDFSKMILDELLPDSLLLVDSWRIGSDKYDSGLNTEYSGVEQYSYVLERFKIRMDNNTVTVAKMTSNMARHFYSEYMFDFIYLDADHRYESVLADLKAWYPLCAHIIGGHDYNNVNGFGVVQAVDEFAAANGLIVDLISEEGDFILRKK